MQSNPSLQTILLSLFPFIIFILFIHNKWTSTPSNPNHKPPPSPSKLPVIGNLLQLRSAPHRALQILSQKHGPIMLLHLGRLPTVVASSSEAAREIMKTHDLSFATRPHLSIPNIMSYGSTNIGFAPYGEYWRQLKSLMTAHLFSNTKVKSFSKLREHEVGFIISLLEDKLDTTVDIGELLARYINNVIFRVAIGRTYDEIKHTNILRKFVDVSAGFSIASYIPWLSWIDRLTGSIERAKRVAKEFDELLEGVIEEHMKKQRVQGGEDDELQDFVDILLDAQKKNSSGFTLHRDSIKAVLLDVFAGTESTYGNLEWAMSALIKNPRTMKKLQQEVTEVAQGRSMISEDSLTNMPYLKAVVKESFRLHTSVPLLVPRKSMHDVKVMGYDITAGTQVLINAWAIGRDPASWDEPTEFRPERFLNSSINYQGDHFELVPFGSGQRICSGMQFSVAIIELALANIVYKFDFGLPNGMKNEDLDMSEAYGLTVHRKSPLLVTVSRRF